MILTRRSGRAQPSTPPASARAIPGWVATVVGLGALLTIAGAVIAIADPAILLDPADHVTGAVRVYAGYLFARNLALGVMLIALLALRARHLLVGLMVLTAAIQVLDVAVDAATGRWLLVPGLLVFAGAFILGARRLADRPLWRVLAWCDAAIPPRP
jgi:hypothetical protein